MGSDDGERWWSVEDLGEGASVVRSKGDGEEKEVRVLRMGETELGESQVKLLEMDLRLIAEDKTLLHALTHSLLMRDRLLNEISRLKSACHQNPSTGLIEHPEAETESRREEWEKLESSKRREKERDREVEEREREVGRREKWVVEEMRWVWYVFELMIGSSAIKSSERE